MKNKPEYICDVCGSYWQGSCKKHEICKLCGSGSRVKMDSDLDTRKNKRKMKKEEEFAYVIGFEWGERLSPNNPKAIGAYSSGGEVENGTLEQAKADLKYVEEQPNSEKHMYKIYKLVEVK